MSATCHLVRFLAPSHGETAFSAQLNRHVGTCLTCQAEIARYGKLRRQLSTLAGVTVAAPRPLTAGVVAAIAPPEQMASTGAASHMGRIVAASGAVAAAAVGAVAVVLWRSSRVVVR
jgi:anti-sigma factor RsiW